MSRKFSTLKERFVRLTPRQRQLFIELLEHYIDCRYIDFRDTAELLKWEKEEARK